MTQLVRGRAGNWSQWTLLQCPCSNPPSRHWCPGRSSEAMWSTAFPLLHSTFLPAASPKHTHRPTELGVLFLSQHLPPERSCYREQDWELQEGSVWSSDPWYVPPTPNSWFTAWLVNWALGEVLVSKRRFTGRLERDLGVLSIVSFLIIQNTHQIWWDEWLKEMGGPTHVCITGRKGWKPGSWEKEETWSLLIHSPGKPMAMCTDNWEPGLCSLTPEFLFLLLLTYGGQGLIPTTQLGHGFLINETQGGSLNAVVFIRKTALRLSFSVNFIPSSLTTMLSFASVHGFLLQIAIWLQELLLTRVYRPTGTSWSPPCHPVLPPQPRNWPSLSPAAASQSKKRLGHLSSSRFCSMCFTHGFPWEEGCHSGKGGDAYLRWDLFFTGKTNLSECSFVPQWSWDAEG